MNLTRFCKDGDSIPASLSEWVKDPTALSFGVVHRCSSHPALVWMWCRPGSVAPICPLVWELPYAAGSALKKEKLAHSFCVCYVLFIILLCLLFVIYYVIVLFIIFYSFFHLCTVDIRYDIHFKYTTQSFSVFINNTACKVIIKYWLYSHCCTL